MIAATLHIDGCDHRRPRVRFTSLDRAHDVRIDRDVWEAIGKPEAIQITVAARLSAMRSDEYDGYVNRMVALAVTP